MSIKGGAASPPPYNPRTTAVFHPLHPDALPLDGPRLFYLSLLMACDGLTREGQPAAASRLFPFPIQVSTG